MDDLINSMFASVHDTLDQFIHSDLMVVFVAVLSIVIIISGSHLVRDALNRAMLTETQYNRRKEHSEDSDHD